MNCQTNALTKLLLTTLVVKKKRNKVSLCVREIVPSKPLLFGTYIIFYEYEERSVERYPTPPSRHCTLFFVSASWSRRVAVI